jgi:glutathione peroxidase
MKTIYDFTVEDINNKKVSLNQYKDKVLLIVNVASECGFTPQYKQLQELYERYKEQGLAILAFPCNQFRNQEPKQNKEIQQFCQKNFGVTFDMFAKIDVNGENTHLLYRFLKEQKSGFLNSEIKWNFTKFLVDRDGKVVQRYAPITKPESIESDIVALLQNNP